MLFEVDWMTHSQLTDRVQILPCMERGDQARWNTGMEMYSRRIRPRRNGLLVGVENALAMQEDQTMSDLGTKSLYWNGE